MSVQVYERGLHGVRSWELHEGEARWVLWVHDDEHKLAGAGNNGLFFAKRDRALVRDACMESIAGEREYALSTGRISARVDEQADTRLLVALGDRPTWRPLAGCGHGRVEMPQSVADAAGKILDGLLNDGITPAIVREEDLDEQVHAPRLLP